MTRIIVGQAGVGPGDSCNFLDTFKNYFFMVLPFFTPTILALLKISTDREKQRVREEFEMFAQMDSNEKRRFLLVQEDQFVLRKEPDWKKILFQIKTKEEHNKKEQLDSLTQMEQGIKQFLHIRCSRFKLKDGRLDVEHDLCKTAFSPSLARLNIYDGLTEILKYDHMFCGGGIEGNGRLYRVYMLYWKSQVEVHKYKNILNNLEKIMEYKNDSFFKS